MAHAAHEGLLATTRVHPRMTQDLIFPDDFMFQLTTDELERLRSQSVISMPPGRGGRRIAPYAFTEQGVAMLSSVCNVVAARCR